MNHFSTGRRSFTLRSALFRPVRDGRGRHDRLGPVSDAVSGDEQHEVENAALLVFEVDQHLAAEASRAAGRHPPHRCCQRVVEVRAPHLEREPRRSIGRMPLNSPSVTYTPGVVEPLDRLLDSVLVDQAARRPRARSPRGRTASDTGSPGWANTPRSTTSRKLCSRSAIPRRTRSRQSASVRGVLRNARRPACIATELP